MNRDALIEKFEYFGMSHEWYIDLTVEYTDEEDELLIKDYACFEERQWTCNINADTYNAVMSCTNIDVDLYLMPTRTVRLSIKAALLASLLTLYLLVPSQPHTAPGGQWQPVPPFYSKHI